LLLLLPARWPKVFSFLTYVCRGLPIVCWSDASVFHTPIAPDGRHPFLHVYFPGDEMGLSPPYFLPEFFSLNCKNGRADSHSPGADWSARSSTFRHAHSMEDLSLSGMTFFGRWL